MAANSAPSPQLGSVTGETFVDLDASDSVTVSSLSMTDVVNPVSPHISRSASHADPEIDAWGDRARICHGIRLHGAATGNHSSLLYSRYPVAIPRESIVGETTSTIDVITASTTSRAEAAFMRLGMSKAAAQTAAPLTTFVDSDSAKPEPPAIHVTCRRTYARMVVSTELRELAPHPNFVADLEAALAMPSQEEQRDGLRDVLRLWGVIIATYLELGCALVTSSSFVTPCNMPSYGDVRDPFDDLAQRGAEKLVHNALRCRVGDRAPGEDELEMKAYRDFSHSLSWKAVGGSSRMQINRIPDAHSLEQSDVWVVISVDRVRPVFDLLHNKPYLNILRRCLDLVALDQVKLIPKASLSPPILHIPGRLVCYTHGSTNTDHINGYNVYELPDFDPCEDFTLGAWIYPSGKHHANSVAMSIRCAEVKRSLVIVGEWARSGKWSALRSHLPEDNHDPYDLFEVYKSLKGGEWQYISYTQTKEWFSLNIDGKVTNMSISQQPKVSVTQLQLFVGCNNFRNSVCDQWDGAIANVKLWQRALSLDEIAGEGHETRRPVSL